MPCVKVFINKVSVDTASHQSFGDLNQIYFHLLKIVSGSPQVQYAKYNKLSNQQDDSNLIPINISLTLSLLVSSAHELCKQFGPRSGPAKRLEPNRLAL